MLGTEPLVPSLAQSSTLLRMFDVRMGKVLPQVAFEKTIDGMPRTYVDLQSDR
jgi:hypothetical protein